MKLKIKVKKGGPGSGHHGHRGRPGKVGGSLPGEGFSAVNRAFLSKFSENDNPYYTEVCDINTGFCQEWAYTVHELYGGEIWYNDTFSHAFVKIGDLYYDAETAEGVEDWVDLEGLKDQRKSLIRLREENIDRTRRVSSEELQDVPGFDGNIVDEIIDKVESDSETFKGGPGSGHHGHRGRPGKVGGSLPGVKAEYRISPNYKPKPVDEDLISIIDEEVGPWQATEAIEELGEKYPDEWGDVLWDWKDYQEASSDWVQRVDYGAKRKLERMLKNNPSVRTLTLYELYNNEYAHPEVEDFPTFGEWLDTAGKERYYRFGRIREEGLVSFAKSEGIARDAENAGEDELPIVVELSPIEMLGFSMSMNGEIYVEGRALEKVEEKEFKGGPGSGHFGHRGRPGKVGGSLPGSRFGAGESPGEDYRHFESGKSVPDENAERIINEGLRHYDPNEKLEDWREVGASDYSTEHAIRGRVKDDIVRTISEETGVEYDKVNEIVEQWSKTSNDEDLRALQLQKDLCDALGVELSEWQQNKYDVLMSERLGKVKEGMKRVRWAEVDSVEEYIEKKFEIDMQVYEDTMERVRANPEEWSDDPDDWLGYKIIPEKPSRISVFEAENELVRLSSFFPEQMDKYIPLYDSQTQQNVISSIYNNTQDRLGDVLPEDTTHLTLYRGFSVPDSMPDDVYRQTVGQAIKYKGNAMESWSTSYDVAEDFAGYHAGERGFVIAMSVPVENIVSTARTGFGCLTEGEIVINASTDVEEQTAYVVERTE